MESKAPVEIERKYIIVMPSADLLSSCDGYTVSDIEQTYLESDEGVTRRVRKRSYSDKVDYTLTEKRRIDKISSYEDERHISREEYLSELRSIRRGTHTVKKTRHTFNMYGKVYEIDVYPEWKRTSIMEAELAERDEVLRIPPFIKVLAEVSGIKKYTNASMAVSFPDEII